MASLTTARSTFLFTDIEGSTRAWDAAPNAMSAALARHDAILRAAIEDHGGRVFKTIGDAFCAVFADPREALAAALAAQHALAAEHWAACGSGRTDGAGGTDSADRADNALGAIRVRMAVHVGHAEQRADDYFGPTLNRVARLMACGHGGQILLSAAAAAGLGDRLPTGMLLRDLGDRRLKDLRHSERVFQVVAVDLPSEFPPLATLDARPNNLPAQLTSFVGREREVAELCRLLRAEGGPRMVTLTGTGGTGKTRLALQVAADLIDDFDHGVWFVNLAPLEDPALVAPTLAAVLGVREVPGQDTLTTLREWLRSRQLLVVLDNFERLLAVAPLVTDLLAAAPGLRVLVTSREPLHLRGERVIAVEPLAAPCPGHAEPVDVITRYPAVELFTQRAVDVLESFKVTAANAGAVGEICARLDGLPLAIELAAARITLFDPQAMLEHLESRLQLLTDGYRDLPSRQRTMRGIIDWSHDLLGAQERTLFRRLAVFRGGWDEAAAKAVCADEALDDEAVQESLSHLVDKSLVVAHEGEDTVRYGLLETVWEYASERLVEAGGDEAPSSRRKHLSYFLALAQETQAPSEGAAAERLARRRRLETDNFRAALGWATVTADAAPDALRLGAALRGYWATATSMVEAQQLFATLAGLDGGIDVALEQAIAFRLHGVFLAYLMRLDEATPPLEEALLRFRALGHELFESWALNELGALSLQQGDVQTAIDQFAASIAIKRRIAPSWDLAIGLNNLAEVYLPFDVDRAERLFQEAWDILATYGDGDHLGLKCTSTMGFGDVAFRRGDYTQAVKLYREALDLAVRFGQKRNWALQRHAWLAAQTGRPVVAMRLLGAVHGLQRARGLLVDNEGTSLPEAQCRDLHAQAVAACREALGDEAFAAAIAAGQALSLDDAVALARAETVLPA